jgi:hypothetical protein
MVISGISIRPPGQVSFLVRGTLRLPTLCLESLEMGSQRGGPLLRWPGDRLRPASFCTSRDFLEVRGRKFTHSSADPEDLESQRRD